MDDEKPSKKGKRYGGRAKGTKNKASVQREAEIKASGLTPLEFLLMQMRDEDQPMAVRIDAAKAVAPYVHPKLASIEHKGNADNPINLQVGFRWMTQEEARGRGWA